MRIKTTYVTLTILITQYPLTFHKKQDTLSTGLLANTGKLPRLPEKPGTGTMAAP
jgi:hypothetical protein